LITRVYPSPPIANIERGREIVGTRSLNRYLRSGGSKDFRVHCTWRERRRSRTAALPRSHVSPIAISKSCFSNGGREVVGGQCPEE